MSLDSIGALQELMEYFDLHPSAHLEYGMRANIRVHGTNQGGSIRFIVNSNWHVGQGPFLDFDETIKSYGVMYTRFTPQFQEITWEQASEELTVKGKGYAFTLSSINPT